MAGHRKGETDGGADLDAQIAALRHQVADLEKSIIRDDVALVAAEDQLNYDRAVMDAAGTALAEAIRRATGSPAFERMGGPDRALERAQREAHAAFDQARAAIEPSLVKLNELGKQISDWRMQVRRLEGQIAVLEQRA